MFLFVSFIDPCLEKPADRVQGVNPGCKKIRYVAALWISWWTQIAILLYLWHINLSWSALLDTHRTDEQWIGCVYLGDYQMYTWAGGQKVTRLQLYLVDRLRSHDVTAFWWAEFKTEVEASSESYRSNYGDWWNEHVIGLRILSLPELHLCPSYNNHHILGHKHSFIKHPLLQGLK